MAEFYRTEYNDEINESYVSPGVSVSPSGAYPSDAADTIYGYEGDDYIRGGGGNVEFIQAQGMILYMVALETITSKLLMVILGMTLSI